MQNKHFIKSLKEYLEFASNNRIDTSNYSELWSNFIQNFSYKNLLELDNAIAKTSRGYAYLPQDKTNPVLQGINFALGHVFYIFDTFTPKLAKSFDLILRRFFAAIGIGKDRLHRFYDPRTISTRKYLKKNK